MAGDTNISLPAGLDPGSAQWLEPGLMFCYSPTNHTEPEIVAYYEAMARAASEYEGRFVVISDTRHIRRMPNARMRRLHGTLAAEFTRRSRGRCVHSITIIDNPLMRGMFSAVMWVLGSSAAPHEAVGSFRDALRLARSKL